MLLDDNIHLNALKNVIRNLFHRVVFFGSILIEWKSKRFRVKLMGLFEVFFP